MPRLGKGTKAFRPSQQTYGAASSTSTMSRRSPDDNDNTAKDNGPSGTAAKNPLRDDGYDQSMPPPPLPPSSLPSSDEEVPPPSSPAPSVKTVASSSAVSTSTVKRKYSALSMSQSSENSTGSGGKKARTTTMSGAVALNGIKASLDAFNHTVERNLTKQSQRSDTELERRGKAITLVQELETGLDDVHLIALIDLFQKDTTYAESYLNLQRESLRKIWVGKRLAELGFPDDLDIHP
jgi:hypothetical protein